MTGGTTATLFFRFVLGSSFHDPLFSTSCFALFFGLFSLCFSGASCVFNNFDSFVSGLFSLCF